MRAHELLPKDITVYVDMDGVLADLFNHAGSIHDVEHYSNMTKDQWEEFFKNSNAYELFRDLPAFPSANKLLQIVKDFAGGYTILSSPLSFDKAGSIKGKREWLKKHIHVSPDNIIFEHDKAKYATANGKPNILIDDYGVNIRAWGSAGGIPIKYQADEDSLQKVFKALQAASRGEVDEGWKDWVAGAGAAAMLAGGGSAAYDAYKAGQAEKEPTAIVAKSDFKKGVEKIAKDAVPKHLVTGSPHEKFLTKEAVAAGIKGEELAQFLAQTAHESHNFKSMVEYGGSLDFKKYEPKFVKDKKTKKVTQVNPKAKTLGNTKVGDGSRYKGRGYIQLTGRYNYKKAGQALGLPLEEKPEMVEKPEVAAKVAVWFWQNRVQPKVDDFGDTRAATKPINSGLKGLENRKEKFSDFKTAMR
jgi:predicted chitinase/5'(3')-deoxyribonucleotidase